jgi:hypothetical protein
MAKFSIKKITNRAKEIRRKHPAMAWLSAVKEAGREYRSGKKKPAHKKKSAVKRRTPKSTPKRKRRRVAGIRTNADRVDRKRVNVTIGSVSHHQSALKKALAERISSLYMRKVMAGSTKKSAAARRKIQREINEVQKKFNKLC